MPRKGHLFFVPVGACSLENNCETGVKIVGKSYCKNFSGIAASEPVGTKNLNVVGLRCKQWSCSYCARVNQRMWRGYLNARIAELGGKWSFMTLTAHPAAHGYGWTLANLRDAWKPIYDAIRYRWRHQKPLEYIRVFEQHKSGNYHVHVLWRIELHPPYEPIRWLAETATHHGLGWRVDWQPIDTGGETNAIARYITKYMSKDAQGMMTMPRGTRRIQTSQGIGAMKPPKNEEEWWLKTGIYPADLDRYEQIKDVSTEYIVTADYFKEFAYYPEHRDNARAMDVLEGVEDE